MEGPGLHRARSNLQKITNRKRKRKIEQVKINRDCKNRLVQSQDNLPKIPHRERSRKDLNVQNLSPGSNSVIPETIKSFPAFR